MEKSVHLAPAAQARARFRLRRTAVRSHSAVGELASGVLEATSNGGDGFLFLGRDVRTITPFA